MSHQPAKKEYETLSLVRSMNEIVELPSTEKENDWLAFHVVEFYHELSLLCKIVRPKFCTKQTCPRMNASTKTEYYWADDNHFKRPEMVSAPEYIDYLMEYIEQCINDKRQFPIETNEKDSYPNDFNSICKKLLRRMARVYGHFYYAHYPLLCELKINNHINSCFQHFIYFTLRYQMVNKQEFIAFGKVVTQLSPNLLTSMHSQHNHRSGRQVGRV